MSPQKRRSLDDAMAASFVYGDNEAPPPAPQAPSEPPPVDTSKPTPKRSTKSKPADSLTTVNIKIPRSQQRWLQDTAQQVRDNNPEPVPPPQRVYPQHLIQAAIALLEAQDVDWSAVRNVEELRDRLNL
ncbi:MULTISPECIES: hypothetical protein [Cyanophyceae]|uniref:Uncharacterized protein n=1 Tax=Leptolyngbya subtilissima DQ-A4 TaxID=2933933 RepID=A0ABV0KBZ6_9CYAN|nr:hypothetical protein [Nodosilinea sp. FACHB-141]MBD2111743.1 hypothetical protein [Nodosilinea sp. FACHB-141]